MLHVADSKASREGAVKQLSGPTMALLLTRDKERVIQKLCLTLATDVVLFNCLRILCPLEIELYVRNVCGMLSKHLINSDGYSVSNYTTTS